MNTGMAGELILYTNPMSRGRTVRWMLEELGVPYETRLLDYGTTMKAADYLAINPMGKVPAIVHDGHVVTETGAICMYLADAFPQAGLAPAMGTAERAAYCRWMFFAAGPVEAAASNTALGFQVPPERKRMTGYGSLEDVLNAIDGHLSKSTYFAGDTFTAADVYAGGSVAFMVQFGLFDKRPSFMDYIARIKDRPAAKRAREMDDALLPPKT